MESPRTKKIIQRVNFTFFIVFVILAFASWRSEDMFKKFNNTSIVDHFGLSEADIKTVAVVTENKTAFTKLGNIQSYYTSLSLQKDYLPFLVYIFTVGLLAAALWFAMQMKSFQRLLKKEDA